MSRLKAQSTASTITPRQAVTTQWPQMQLPPLDPRFGSMNSAHVDYLQTWYAGVQGAVNTRLASMSDDIEELKSQLKSTAK
jgi:maltose-binding protein MalE